MSRIIVKHLCFLQAEDIANVDLNDDLKCPVCHELCTLPRECSACGRLFCSSCIAHLTSCPLCLKEPFDSHDNLFASRLVNNVRVKCGHCESQVDSAHLEEHQKTCDARKRKCSFQGCDFVASNRDEAVHHLNTVHVDHIWTNFERLPPLMSSGKYKY